MNMSKSSLTNPHAQKAILTAGFVAGALDIIAAFVNYYCKSGKNPLPILKFIASGVFGTTALSGGVAMMVLGLVFHFLIAFGFTLFFFWLYPKIKIMATNKWITAIIYGFFVWAVMNFIILPLSRTPKMPFKPSSAIIAMLILICMIGLPVTWIIGKYYERKRD
jgi:hypothetical protein